MWASGARQASTLNSPGAIDLLLWEDGRRTNWRRRLWLSAVALPVQLLWCVRAILLPACAAAGSAFIFGTARNAQDIVLNSVAIAFIFDMDELCFTWVLGPRQRAAFEEAITETRQSAAAARVARGVQVYGWLVFLLDVTLMIVSRSQPPVAPGSACHI